MKIELNSEALRMTVLKQIVSNALLGMKNERELNIIDYIFPYTPKRLRLKRLRKRGDRLQEFETALRVNKSELVEISHKDVDFIYEGLL